MNSKQRIKNALMRKQTDMLPVVNLFDLGFLARQLDIEPERINAFIEDPVLDMVSFQESINHDPLISLCTNQEISAKRWYNSLITSEKSNFNSWNVTDSVHKTEGDCLVVKRIVSTPSGKLTAFYRKETFTDWVLEHPIKSEGDIDMLLFRPDPKNLDYSKLKRLTSQFGDRAFILFTVSGVWQEACALRGLDKMVYDLYDRPKWVHRFFEILSEYTCRIVSELGHLCLDCIMLNESQLGVGISRKVYCEHIKNYDEKILEMIKTSGLISSYHICGLCSSLLEDMAESGATCVEPLAPREYSGDVELHDAVSRIGSKVGIWGGFKERVLSEDKDVVQREVARCKSETEGAGYVLRGSGQIYDAKKENLKWIREFSL